MFQVQTDALLFEIFFIKLKQSLLHLSQMCLSKGEFTSTTNRLQLILLSGGETKFFSLGLNEPKIVIVDWAVMKRLNYLVGACSRCSATLFRFLWKASKS